MNKWANERTNEQKKNMLISYVRTRKSNIKMNAQFWRTEHTQKRYLTPYKNLNKLIFEFV